MKRFSKLKCLIGAFTVLGVFACQAAEPPQPFGPTPSERQLIWHEMELTGFIHFTTNTFTDREWEYGDVSPSVFNPTDFDADQIVAVAKEAGIKMLVFTCKHINGFCLWPSKYTEYSVKHSPWKNGQGDMVKEFADACRRHGLKFGIYIIPADRNHKDYGGPEYITYYRNQLRELLTGYGPIHEVWIDGAKSGGGYYGGAREKRIIDSRSYYDWPNTFQLIRELQPNACIFSDCGPDIRYVGNERGIAGETCWATLNREDFAPGAANNKRLNSGDRPGTHWVPADCDVSIRPSWFYHPVDDEKVRSPENLLMLYFASIGRGAGLLLNLPPDRRGLIHENDIQSLRGFRRLLDETFATDFAGGAQISASNTRGGDAAFAPKHLLDNDSKTYWATDDNVTTASVELTLPRPATFNVVMLQEYIPLGQRITAFTVEAFINNEWQKIGEATSIGYKRLLRTTPATTDRVRINITHADACPALSAIGLYFCPVEFTEEK